MAKERFDVKGFLKSIRANEISSDENKIDTFFVKSLPIRLVVALIIIIFTAIIPWSGFIKNIFTINKLKLICNMIACILSGCDILWRCITEISKKKVGDYLAISLAAILTVFCGESVSAAIALVLFQFSRLLIRGIFYYVEHYSNFFSISVPQHANVVVNGISAQREIDSVQIGNAIVVESGELIPLDGIIRSGNSQIDSYLISGTHDLRKAIIGDKVCSGEINKAATIIVEVTSVSADSTLQRMGDAVAGAFVKRPEYISRFDQMSSKIFLAMSAIGLVASIIISILLKLQFSSFIKRFAMFVSAACSGSSIAAIALIYFIYSGKEAEKGVLVKSPTVFDNLSDTLGVYFNKTGTLTDGEYRIIGISANKISRETLFALVAYIESGLNHPIARAIETRCEKKLSFNSSDTRSEVPGAGIYAVVDGNEVHIGSQKLMESIDCPVKSYDNCEFYVAINRQYAGTIVMEENIRRDALDVSTELHAAGVKEVGIISCDSEKNCKKTAEALGADAVYSEMRSDEKMVRLEQIKKRLGGKVAYVGCDAEDTAAIAYADTGILQFHSSDDLVSKSPDVILMRMDLHKIPDLVVLSNHVKMLKRRVYILALISKIILLVLTSLGLLGVWFVVLLDFILSTLVTDFMVLEAKKR